MPGTALRRARYRRPSPLTWRATRPPGTRPDPAQRSRLEQIRDNLIARIAEAEREGWLGEMEGLQVSLAGSRDKLAQIDAEAARRSTAVRLGMPASPQIGVPWPLRAEERSSG